MDAVDLLLSRRSVLAVNIGPPGPDDEALQTMLRIATRVPDHGKLTPWRIQVLREEGQRQLGDLLARLFAEANPAATEKQVNFERNRLQRAPLLLAVTAKIRPNHKIPEMEQLLSAGAVCYSLLIAATAVGYAAQWLTEWPAYRPEVVEALGHDPQTDRIVGFVYLGTATEPPAERPRPELADIVSDWPGDGDTR
jgi:nitroreductase